MTNTNETVMARVEQMAREMGLSLDNATRQEVAARLLANPPQDWSEAHLAALRTIAREGFAEV